LGLRPWRKGEGEQEEVMAVEVAASADEEHK